VIYFDVTKSGGARHQSGLVRLNDRLREELGQRAVPVRWDDRQRTWVMSGAKAAARFSPADCLLRDVMFRVV
jgi:hypothetical protein